MTDTSAGKPADILLVSPAPFLIERFAGRMVQPKEAAELDEAGRAAIRVLVGDGHTPVTAEHMDRFPNLGLIVTIAAGHDGVDKASADARGIPIKGGAGVNSEDVADHAMALLLASARYIIFNDTKIRTGGWKGRGLRPVPSVSSLKVGIVGLGSIGKAVAARLAPFRCEVAWTGPRPKPDVALRYVPDLIELATWANVLVIATPLDPSTNRLVGREVIDALGPQGLIVNVARGAVIDEDELIAALKEGRLGSAALDVFETEPTPPARWEGVPNVILTPHVAGVTHEAIAGVFEQAARNALEFVGER